MKSLILAGNKTYGDGFSDDLSTLTDQAVGVVYNDNGQLKLSSDGTEFSREAMLVLGRTMAEGSPAPGPVVLPLFRNHFSFVKGEYQASTTFEATITIPTPFVIGTYTIIVVKKGMKFNYRNKYTSSVFVKSLDWTAADLAQKLADDINNKTVASGVTATVDDDTITIKGVHDTKDYAILGADFLTGTVATVNTIGSPAYGDAKYIVDLANKAAADAGFEYTYKEAREYLYPHYPLNPLMGESVEDNGYTIFTLRFAEPRDVKTRDEVVHQLIQVAFPTGASAIETFENVCNGLADNA